MTSRGQNTTVSPVADSLFCFVYFLFLFFFSDKKWTDLISVTQHKYLSFMCKQPPHICLSVGAASFSPTISIILLQHTLLTACMNVRSKNALTVYLFMFSLFNPICVCTDQYLLHTTPEWCRCLWGVYKATLQRSSLNKIGSVDTGRKEGLYGGGRKVW